MSFPSNIEKEILNPLDPLGLMGLIIDTDVLAVWYIDADLNFLYANQNWETITGLNLEDIQQKWWDFVHPDDVERTKTWLVESIVGKKNYQSRIRFGYEGHYTWLDLKGRHSYNINGIKDGIVGIAVNVDDEELEYSKRKLYESALVSSSTPILITDKDEHIVFSNPAFSEHTGYKYDEIMGKKPSFLYDQEDKEVLEDLEYAISHKKEVETIVRSYRKDGSIFINKVQISPVFIDGELTNFIGVHHDITEEVHCHQLDEFKKAVAKLAMGGDY